MSDVIQIQPLSVTASSSDKATHLQTMQQNTSVTSKSNTGVNEGTMTDLTWIELPRKLVQSKDASTQWEKQPPTHSTQTASTSSTQDLDKPSCGDDGELEQDGLGWCLEDTPAVQEDEFMDSSEPSDVHIGGSNIVAWSKGDVEETTVAESQERERSNTPILRRIKEEMIDEFEEGDYQTLYVKEEYLEDDCQDDDYAHVHLTSGGHPRLEAESPRSTQQTNSDRAPRQNGGPWIGSKKMYGLKFHVTQGNTKVECAINSPSETVKGENLKEAICHKLQVSLDAHSLQYFDKSWQDWVDIAPLMALIGGLQLRVIQTSLGDELSHQIPTTNSQNNHRLKYLVALGNNKQVLTVDSPESTASGAAVKEAVRSMLHDLADGLLLQYFDKDWQDWIDVELSMMLEGRMRLNFIQTNLRAELSHQTSTSNSQNKHRLKYLVALGNNKQVLTIDSPKSTASGAAVKEAVCGMLRDLADGLMLQYFDEGWQDWIDVEPSMMLGGRMRLNVLQASHKSLSDLRC
ncbi:uncharacterized protein LOC587622 isoform X3 [Strongylocentrotus purpuratus]|uniref:Uncharacterized protein n=1 Tax=Strongylocentrotus purpuratus TaxID=7668 RepID=A0A7M7NKD5_STRPU|nr:uncharacterized protein LOC587622 isoform X3 [Strongylocentrotus purpuratus]